MKEHISSSESGRRTYNFNRGWKFHLGDIQERNFGSIHASCFDAPEWLKAGNHGLSRVDFPDLDWADIDLPHDYVVEGQHQSSANAVHGSLPVKVAWYRKRFRLPEASSENRWSLEFDGVFRDCEIWLNGHFVGRHLSGYTSFSFDITELCEPDAVNALAVRVDPTRFELWSYEGGGIYRDVRLVRHHAVRISPNGIHAQTRLSLDGGTPKAELKATVSLNNDSADQREGSIVAALFDPDGNRATCRELVFSVTPLGTSTVELALTVDDPILWDTSNPALYQLEVSLIEDGEEVDDDSVRIGFRSIRFDPEEGFFLNGKAVKIKGVCEHQDHAGVGVAIPHALQKWRLQRLLDLGANALRTAHNPPDPAVLDLCDEMGILVVNETRLSGTSPEILEQMSDLIRRDRNHPCVMLWSLGNEEMIIQECAAGPRILKRMQEIAHQLDPDRPCTYSANCDFNAIAQNFDAAGFRIDVFGANYTSRREADGHLSAEAERYDEFHARFPDWPLIASEAGGTASTRGLYGPEFVDGERLLPDVSAQQADPFVNLNPSREGHATAYAETLTPWGRSIEDTWKDCASRPYLAGTFLWTGFDYRGETYPFGWPSVVTRYGLMDLCGFPKDAYFYYQSCWSDDPVLHLLPHWNWAGSEGSEIDVWCYTNCAVVELFLNGNSLGRKEIEEWGKGEWKVAYAAGCLEAIGYDSDGIEVRRDRVETTGAPTKIQLRADRPEYFADGRDTLIIRAEIQDTEGRIVRGAACPLTFQIEGEAVLIGVGNGDPNSHEAEKANCRRAYDGLVQILLRSENSPGVVTVRASSPQLKAAELVLPLIPTEQSIPEVGAAEIEDRKELKGTNPIDGAL